MPRLRGVTGVQKNGNEAMFWNGWEAEEWLLGGLAGCFFAAGLLFRSGRGARLIAGYNTMPRRERERIDRRKLCRTMALFMAYCGCMALLDLCSEPHGYVLGIGLPIGAVVLLVYSNTGNRFGNDG